MQAIKVTLNVTLPGGVMISREEARKSPKMMDHSIINIKYPKYVKASKKKELITETLHIFTRKCIPAQQSLNISLESYQWMISKESYPYYIRKKSWENMSKKERLEVHLADLCKDFGGIKYTYEILPD